MLVLTLNRGMLTLRMPGQTLEPAQLKMVGQLYGVMAQRLLAMGRSEG